MSYFLTLTQKADGVCAPVQINENPQRIIQVQSFCFEVIFLPTYLLNNNLCLHSLSRTGSSTPLPTQVLRHRHNTVSRVSLSSGIEAGGKLFLCGQMLVKPTWRAPSHNEVRSSIRIHSFFIHLTVRLRNAKPFIKDEVSLNASCPSWLRVTYCPSGPHWKSSDPDIDCHTCDRALKWCKWIRQWVWQTNKPTVYRDTFCVILTHCWFVSVSWNGPDVQDGKCN